jgi:hypothetical protein
VTNTDLKRKKRKRLLSYPYVNQELTSSYMAEPRMFSATTTADNRGG